MFCVCHFAIEERYYILLVNGFSWNLLSVGVPHCLDNGISELFLECLLILVPSYYLCLIQEACMG